jgi:hypothetical protein
MGKHNRIAVATPAVMRQKAHAGGKMSRFD